MSLENFTGVYREYYDEKKYIKIRSIYVKWEKKKEFINHIMIMGNYMK